MKRIFSSVTTVAAVCAGMICSSSCVNVDNSIGESMIPDNQLYNIYTAEFPIEDIRQEMADSLSGYSMYKFTFGALQDETFGLTTRSAAFTLVPINDTLDFGKNPVFRQFHMSAVSDSTSYSDPSQQYILQNVNVYELDKAINYNKLYPEISYTKKRITDGIPVYNGSDSLSFDFSREFGEKFFDIKCRKAGLNPSLTILVATLRGLKMHGDVPVDKISEASEEGVRKGFANLDRHIENMRKFRQSVLVCFNKFGDDRDDEIRMVREHCAELGVPFALNDAFSRGGEGAVELAELVVKTIDSQPSEPVKFIYRDEESIENKITRVAKEIYRAGAVEFSPEARKMLAKIEGTEYAKFPVCIAKTQYSFSQDPKLYGAPEGFEFDIKDVVINAGAEMIVAIAGDIIRMPGLPKSPQALRIDVKDGAIDGLS